ncbi:MAG: DoxX family protein [Pseudomonadota bacterium]
MTAIDTLETYTKRTPGFPAADWVIRIPLAIIILQQGWMKIPGFAEQAESYGLPLVLFGLATFAELAGGAAILIGGLIRNWMGDLLTRLGGLAIATVVAGVIVMIYFGPFIGWQLQGLLLAGGLFLFLRGNGEPGWIRFRKG